MDNNKLAHCNSRETRYILSSAGPIDTASLSKESNSQKQERYNTTLVNTRVDFLYEKEAHYILVRGRTLSTQWAIYAQEIDINN